MAGDGVAVDAGLAAAVASWVQGQRFDVSAACRDLGVSRTTFYKYAARFAERGVDGFYPDSRRPRSCPAGVVLPSLAEAIVRARKELAEAGMDDGAISVRGWLEDHRERWQPPPLRASDWLPSRMTVHRVLQSRGMVVPAPAKAPRRRSWRRFEATKTNELWQMDGFEVTLADGSTAVVIHGLDDCTRTDLVAHAARSENGIDVWAAFSAAAERYGLPAMLLTDNGSAFSGARRGWTSALERGAHALGVKTISSSVGHPQTCGKCERAHGTARKWLARQPAARDLIELQRHLETYRLVYNDRRHQGLNGLTPNQRRAIAERAGPAGQPLTSPLHLTRPPVTASGCITVDDVVIGLGRRHARQQATVFRNGDDVTVFIANQLIRELTIDRARHYQPQQP